jgi:hypothetical protein
MEVGWLRCKVLPGMFSNERLVVIESPARGEIAWILVDSALVDVTEAPHQGQAVAGKLRVRAHRSGDNTTVMLPVASQEIGRFISVPSEFVAW